MGKRFPQPIPFGWFCVGYSDELESGEVRATYYFGKEQVLFRNESGEAVMLDAYCPHLGAHLGHGGKVDGDSIRCPFHAWAFNKDGICTDVPYATNMPPKVQDKQCIPRYPTVEKNKVIWAWYHPEGIEPFFEVMEHEELASPDWVDLKKYQWNVKTNVQEIAENGVDIAHFRYIHSMEAVPEGETTYDGHIRHSMAQGPREVQQPDGTSKIITSTVNTVQNGAGQKFTRIQGLSETLLMVLVTPVTDEEVELRFAFSHKNFPEDSMEYAVAQMAIDSVIGETGVVGDIPIWEYKKHHENPVLCDGDGPIMRYRKYFQQFYAENAA